MNERARDRDPLPHSARELRRIPLLRSSEPQFSEQIGRTLGKCLSIQPSDLLLQQDVVECGAEIEQQVILEDNTDIDERSLQLLPVDHHRTFRRRDKSRRDQHQGAFAAPRRTDDADEFSRLDLEIRRPKGMVHAGLGMEHLGHLLTQNGGAGCGDGSRWIELHALHRHSLYLP